MQMTGMISNIPQDVQKGYDYTRPPQARQDALPPVATPQGGARRDE